jgi:pimeloyl-ACP methyl ester carboxylesterase
MRWPNESVWRRWGIGEAPGQPFSDTQYPTKYITQLQASITPVYTGGGRGRFGNTTTTAALIQLLEKVGPANVIVHSASGAAGYQAASKRPDLFNSLIAIEPLGSPTDRNAVEPLWPVPFLTIFGDHFDTRRMEGRFEAAKTTARFIESGDGRAKVIQLPEEGISGNSHLMMQAKNSDNIADLIREWVVEIKK